MKINKIIEIVSGELLNSTNIDKNIKKIRIDSRRVNKGDLFIAIIGNNLDGHEYIDEPLLKKASAIIVEKKIAIKTKTPIIFVRDTKKALGDLAKYKRQKHDIPVIAITGSVGKTMTKELIALMLEEKYSVLKSQGNMNNHIGLPMTLLELSKKHEIVVVELGMNHLGEIDYLSNICLPNTSVITNVGTAHIGNLKSRKNIFKAKMEITSGMTDGNLILNGDDKYLKRVRSKKLYIKKCGTLKKNDLVAFDIHNTISFTTFKIEIDNILYQIKLNLPGNGLVLNTLIAIEVALTYGVSMNHITKTIEEYKPLNNRLNMFEINDNILIDDCYNSSYESVISILELIKAEDKKKLIILGDILELGKKSKTIHKKIGEYLKTIPNKEVLLVGEMVKYIKGIYFKDVNELINYLNTEDIINSLILIKASRKIGLDRVREVFIKNIK